MWIFLNDGFFSIVEHRTNLALFQVRARKAGDLQRVFGVKSKSIIKMPHRDYMYRVYMEKAPVAKILADRILNIDYGNFKDSIADHEKDRKQAYSGVWSEMFDWQDDLHPENSRKKWYEDYRNPAYQATYGSPKGHTPAARKHAEELYYDVFNGKDYKYTEHEDNFIEDEEDHQVLYPHDYHDIDEDIR